jgi:Flp pilus assembly CpaF family ATPase
MPLKDFTASNLSSIRPAEPARPEPVDESTHLVEVSAPVVTVPAPVEASTALGALELDLIERLKNRIFDVDCNEIRIIGTAFGEVEPYRALISVGTRYYDASEEILPTGCDEATLRKVIAGFILANMSSSALDGSSVDVVTRGTFYLEEGVEKRASRVQVFYPPVAHRASFNMQLVSKQERDLGSLIDEGTVSMDIGYFLGAAVTAGASIVFSGPPGAGKTTLMNACSQEIPNENPRTGDSTGHEMVVAIQDSDELDLGHLKYVQEFFSFEDAARALGMRADGTMSDLIEITKVARADRILLGEVRGREAFDFLEAASIFRGNMTTLHANSAIQAINNIVVYALRHPNAQVSGLRSVQEMVAKGVDLLVQVDRVNDRRVVTQVVALDGTVSEDGSPRRVVLWNYDTHTGTWVKPADSAGLPDSQERLSGRLAAAGLPDYWRHPELIGS